ncbi:MAG: SCP2 sterol-binding domain-containing protein [Chloroflexota bacterium]
MGNAIPFATDAWIKRLGEECNQSQTYYEAARNWEGDLYFVVEPEDKQTEPVYMYIDLYHGRCRQAFVPEDHTRLTPEFTISGPLSAWRELADKKADPIKMLLTRKLSLKGNMAKVMRNVRAAHALVNCSTRFETAFPSD